MRTLLLALTLAPYFYYSAKDNAFHFGGRAVRPAEHLAHVVIAFAAVGTAAAVFLSRHGQLLRALPTLLAAGAVDEFLFHRGLPEPESDWHAKAHWSLFAFVAAGLLWS